MKSVYNLGMENSSDKQKATEQLEQLVRMDTLDADEVSIASSATIATVKKDSDAGREREKSYRDLMMQLDSVNKFLKRLDAMIEEASRGTDGAGTETHREASATV